jgi:beta-glucosidase-like glycosyl hydrolase/CubicO group peptidase (beta-lactamase class C family)
MPLLRKHLLPVLYCCFALLLCFNSRAQRFLEPSPAANHWVDSVFNSLTPQQKITQLMVIRAHSNLGPEHVEKVTNLIQQYNVGGLCFFQGGPVRQAKLTNYYQSLAKTPLLICIDGEWGLGMRLDSIINFQRQLMMGAVPDAQLVYEVGKAIALQCKRLGIHVNYAPVVDINNNAANPVINDRSFGEDKYKVALLGIQYMKGMQDQGIMACAKHFPGHGDVSVDSHYDLPVINKTRQQLDSLELYPFKEMIKAGVGSVMIAHLSVPAIDTTRNKATSLSYNNVTALLKNELGFKGITFTDGLEMQGVQKYFPDGEVSVQSLIAGNDMLCLPTDIEAAVQKTLQAIQDGRLNWPDLDNRVKKVLLAKYNLGLSQQQMIDTLNITADINAATNTLKKQIAEQAITLVRLNNNSLLPLQHKKKIAYVGIGIDQMNTFAAEMKETYNAKIFLLSYKDSTYLPKLLKKMRKKYKAIIVGVHAHSRRPANNFGLSNDAVTLLQTLQEKDNAIIFSFGNPYVIANFKNARNLVACYEDDNLTQLTAAQLLQGYVQPKGKLPVTVADSLPFGTGITSDVQLPVAEPASVGMNAQKLQLIDSIALDAIARGAMPGCVVLAAKNGKLVYHKAFGFTTYQHVQPVTTHAIYDLASITKTAATTLAIMKLYEEGKLHLHNKIAGYLPWLQGTDKAPLTLRNLLLHQAGLTPFIPFYKFYTDSTGKPLTGFFNVTQNAVFPYRVADSLYVRNDIADSLNARIAQSKLSLPAKYVYSDNDFILLAQVVEAITGQPLEQFVSNQFYQPMGLTAMAFHPLQHYPLNSIVPSEQDTYFRHRELQGDVNDEGAALFGGAAGHAGLFGNAYNLARIYQMLLNGGTYNNHRYLLQSTIDTFTVYGSAISRRGLGFDKPEKDNQQRKEPYPCKNASPATFGHTGFTGTCVWADPQQQLVYVFLSNRVYPNRANNKLSQMNIRTKIQEVLYQAIQ